MLGEICCQRAVWSNAWKKRIRYKMCIYLRASSQMHVCSSRIGWRLRPRQVGSISQLGQFGTAEHSKAGLSCPSIYLGHWAFIREFACFFCEPKECRVYDIETASFWSSRLSEIPKRGDQHGQRTSSMGSAQISILKNLPRQRAPNA